MSSHITSIERVAITPSTLAVSSTIVTGSAEARLGWIFNSMACERSVVSIPTAPMAGSMLTGSSTRRYVALKIGVANPGWADHELEVLQELGLDNSNHPGKIHVQQLLDSFEHVGPNGTHTCFVCEPAGRKCPTTSTR